MLKQNEEEQMLINVQKTVIFSKEIITETNTK